MLVLDSDSSDESEDDDYRRLRQHYNDAQGDMSRLFGFGESEPSQSSRYTPNVGPKESKAIPKKAIPLVSPPPSPSQEDCDESSSYADDEQIQQNQQRSKKLTKNQKKRRQRRKKKKATREQENEENSQEKSKHVSFSNVAIREFPRAFSGDTVPGHGGWPLGMKLDGYEDLDQVSIESYETAKQDQLRARWMEILSSTNQKPPGSPTKSPSPSKKTREKEKLIDEQIIRLMDGSTSIDSCENDDSNDTTMKHTTYETRQWDYRSRVRNPLFGVMSEDERHAAFLEASGTDVKMALESPTRSSRRKRSNSFGNHNHSGGGTRSRSNSLGNHDLGNGIKGKFNEEYSQAMVHHVRNELEQIRFERNKSGATGCNCRKLVVYLPPKDGSGGKKAQHRRLKPSKVVQELKKRNLYDESVAKMSREQMEKLLHKTVESEPCCRDESCFCFRNGINCQADACSCWHDSHVHAKHSSVSNGDALTNDEIRKRCGNPLGTYLVDIEAIERYRTELIQQAVSNDSGDMFICRPAPAS